MTDGGPADGYAAARGPTRRLAGDAAGVDAAAALIVRGGLVAFPTETVYGLGADATDGRAVAGIFAAKGRPRFNPLIVHVADLAAAQALAVFDRDALDLAAAFWPGPLTLVLPLAAGPAQPAGPAHRSDSPHPSGPADAVLSPLVTAGLGTVALRVPGAPLARALLAAAGVPVAAPSANPSGRISPTTADHVLDAMDGRIDAVLDGGACEVGVESTIVATRPMPCLLRPGGLPAETVAACLGRPLGAAPADGRPAAPGQLASHYAPHGRLRMDVARAAAGEVLLGFGPVDAALNLSRSGDLAEAAANLFGHLQTLDRLGVRRIAVSPVPRTGLGLAINDRLRRAAAPRHGSDPG